MTSKVVGALGLLLLFGTATARADFIMDPDPGGVMFFNDKANKDVDHFFGNVGGNGVGPEVRVDTIGNVDTGSGFSNIKPVKGGTLTDIKFTPDNPNLFTDFSFRGQLLKDANGTVTLTVQDNQMDPAQTITFTGLGANADFARIGIVAKSGSGETIKFVELSSDFKEEKQNEFSGQGVDPIGVPEPATLTLLGLGLAGLAGYAWRRKRLLVSVC